MTKTFIRTAVAGALFATAASPAFAADTGTSLGVSAEVTANCVVSSLPVAFGNVDVTSGAADLAQGSISVTCTSGTTWSAAADVGAGTGATFASRKMADDTNLLNYVLHANALRTQIWGDGVSSTVLMSGTGTGGADVHTVYGSVFAGQSSLPAGSYADTVQVTVTY